MKKINLLLAFACVSLLQLSLNAADTSRDACPEEYVKIYGRCVRTS